MHYRLYQPGDFDQLYAIEETCFQPPIRFTRSYLRELVERSNAVTWIAEDQSAIAGFSVVDFESDPQGVLAYIQTIEVLPAFRNQGVGSELLCHIEESAREREAVTIRLHVDERNEGAIRLYERFGYRQQARQPHYYARGRAAQIYVKHLRDPR